MRSCSLLLIACACATAPKPAAETAAAPAREPAATRIVSVLELRNKQQLRDGPGIDAGYVADRLRAEVLGAGIDARVISRENMLVLLQAQGNQLADCEGECEVETGRRIGADLVVSGEILRVGESLKASLRLHETRSGMLVAAATAAGSTAEELDSRLASAVRQLVAPLQRPASASPARSSGRGAASFDPRVFAASQPSPWECETAARPLHETAPEQGWAALVACIERQGWPRGDFTYLERITTGFWDQDLTTRPDAPRVIARIIASRGGDVEGDIPLVQKSRVPLFTLAAALRQPDVYKGRWVLVRGALSEIKQEGNKAAALIAETSLRATSHEVQDGPIRRYDSSSKGSGQGEFSSGSRTTNSSGSSSRTHYKASGDGAASPPRRRRELTGERPPRHPHGAERRAS